MRTCSICPEIHLAKGYCSMHYARWRRNGDPLVVKVSATTFKPGDARVVGNDFKATHGRSRTPLYAVWRTMHARCENPNHIQYLDYGGRGIKVCERWLVFENFLADMGERPPDPEGWTGKRAYWTLDRIDPDGDYEPSNVRWASSAEQAKNRRKKAG